MVARNSLTTACVLQAFSDEIVLHGGRVNDTFDDGTRLFVRSVLPRTEEVRADDRLQGGVALRACGDQVWIHPYVFRLVCSNGAIMANAVASRRVTVRFELEPEEAVSQVREAVRACCVPEVFTNSAQQIRSIADTQVDFALNMLPMLAQLRGSGTGLMQQILERCFAEGDLTQFGFMNAVTSVARDTADPETRWNLEELGGGIPVAAPKALPRQPARGAARRRRAEVVC